MPRKETITLRMIADDLGLTIHTVSKALRGLPGMSETTRKEVVQRARELGYRTKEQKAGITAERIPWTRAKPRRFAMLVTGDSSLHRLQMEGVRLRLNELGHSLYPGQSGLSMDRESILVSGSDSSVRANQKFGELDRTDVRPGLTTI